MPRLFVCGIAAALFAVTVLLFAGNARNEFSRLDDPHYLLGNVHIRGGLSPASAGWALTAVGFESNWHPLTWMSHALDISVGRAFGLDVPDDPAVPIPYSGPFSSLCHWENVILHGLNVALLFGLLVLLTDTTRWSVIVAGFFALLWGLHPLRVEVIAWVAERKELLSVFFMLLTLVSYLIPHPSSLIPLFFFALALMAKPVAVSLPVVLLAYEILIACRPFRTALARTAPLFLASAAVCVLTMMAQGDALKMGGNFPFLQRLTCAIEAPAVYLAQTFWPQGLSIGYAMPTSMTGPHFAAGVVLLVAMAALVAGAVSVWRRPADDVRAGWLRLSLFAIAWAYVGLVPMLGFVKVGYQPHSDRYTYWVGCGVAAVCALAMKRLAAIDWRRIGDAEWTRCWPRIRLGGQALACAALVACGAASVVRSADWRTSRALFSDAVRKAHLENDAALLADSLLSEGHAGHAPAIEMARDVLAARHSPFARSLLAYVLATGGASGRDMVEARQLAEYALEDPDYGRHLALAALAIADMRENRFVTALAHMEEAVANGYECSDETMARLRRKAGGEGTK